MGRLVNGIINDVEVRLRRSTSANWYFVNPVLADGEPALETDTNKLKFGNGITPYNNLPYFGNTSSSTYTAGSGISISGSNVISLASNNISQFTNDSGYITAGSLTGYVPYTGATATVNLNQQAFLNSSIIYVNGVTGAFPNTRVQIYDNVNSFSQLNYMNLNAGASASGDLVVTADNGTDTTNFTNIGINSSGYSDATFSIGGANDGYLYTTGGHQLIGTGNVKDIIFFTGGTTSNKEVLRISSTPGGATAIFNLKGSITASSGIIKAGYISTTLNAAANNDILVGLDVFPTYVAGAFTGINNLGIRSIGADILVNSIYVGKGVGNPANNTIISTNSLRSNTGDSNTMVGTIAGRDGTSVTLSTAIGASALSQSLSATSVTAIGRGAAFTLTGGTSSTYLGSSAGLNASQSVNPTNQTVIGALAYGDTDNQVFIGNSSVTAIKFAQSKLNFTIPAAATSVVFASGSTFTTVGAFAVINTYTAITNATFPTGSGTLTYLGGTNTWTGQQSVTTPTVGDNTTKVASTAFVQTAKGSQAYVAKTALYTVVAADYTIDCTSGTFAVTLLTAVGNTGKIYTIKNSGAGVITLNTTTSQTIDGVTSKSLSVQYSTITVMSNGANWIILSMI